MAGVPLLEKLAHSIPRGEDGFWQIILELDALGPWTIADVDKRSNVARGTVSGYCTRLIKAGYIEPIGTRDHPRRQFGPSATYHVLKAVDRAPHLRKDGSELPEPLIETIWRTVKMSKRNFTAREICMMISGDEKKPTNINTVRSYLGQLCRVGIIARADGGKKRSHAGGGTDEARFRLVNNLGGRAPKILASKLVFDPNAGTIVGITLGEVRT